MYCRVNSAMITGVEALHILVEADISSGMPFFSIVGNVSVQVREAHDRVRTALRQVGISLPPKRITINLSPGDIRKDGTHFDAAIAALVLAALEAVPAEGLACSMILGELRLDGSIAPVRGVLPSVLLAKERGCKICIVPAENYEEACLIREIRIIPVCHLQDLISFLKNGTCILPEKRIRQEIRPEAEEDFSDIRGQIGLKRACMIAAAGWHHLLLQGPPGVGKSMAAKRIQGLLGTLGERESLEVSKIYSIAGLLKAEQLVLIPPFRAPHFSVTRAALCGGGLYPKPGEMTLAHHGILFLDELSEMKRETIEGLRQVLEEKRIKLSRTGGSVLFPADFLLVAAMNPCPCGHYPDLTLCRCTESERNAYQKKISFALLDRIALCCSVRMPEYTELTKGGEDPYSTAYMKEKVERAQEAQRRRYHDGGEQRNGTLGAQQLKQFCMFTRDAEKRLENAFRFFRLSARGYHQLIKVARTIADLEGDEQIHEEHVSEAVCFRSR